MNTRELKPCAFCNSVKVTLFSQPGIAWVQCRDCETDGPPKDTAGEAISAWNRRAGEARLLDALKRCRFDSLNMSREDMEFITAAIQGVQK